MPAYTTVHLDKRETRSAEFSTTDLRHRDTVAVNVGLGLHLDICLDFSRIEDLDRLAEVVDEARTLLLARQDAEVAA